MRRMEGTFVIAQRKAIEARNLIPFLEDGDEHHVIYTFSIPEPCDYQVVACKNIFARFI
jgi:hypothetical protein